MFALLTTFSHFIKTIILPVVLHVFETWLPTLRKNRRLRVFKNRLLRRISGPKKEELTGEWRLHNEKLYALYSSINIIRVIESRRIRRAGRETCTWARKCAHKFWWGNLQEGAHMEHPGVNERMILKCVFRKWNRKHTRLVCIRIVTGGGNKLSGSIKFGEFLD
jgi:hypothetical protein